MTEYPREQLDELKRYCRKLSAFEEGGITFLFMEGLRLPAGCDPQECDALLCPAPRDNYPSRLYLSVQVASQYTRNWNTSNARIGEKNWFAFSWKVELSSPTLVEILMAHLAGFTRE